MDDAWRRWFFDDGRLRTVWRVLLFVAALLLLVQLPLLLLPWLAEVRIPRDRLSPGLIAQAALVLIAALLAGWAMLHWVDRRPASELGFGLSRRVPGDIGRGLVVGCGGMLGAVLLVGLIGGYQLRPDPGTVTGWLAVSGVSLLALALPAAAEEAVFRGYLLRTLREGAGAGVAVAVTSLLFAWAHGSNPNVGVIGLLNIFLAGVLLAQAVIRTASLWFASALHLGWNWVMAGPLDLPVSGLESYDVPLYDLAAPGPPWLTGAGFGPEGGLAGTLAVLIALGLLMWTTRAGPPPAATGSRGAIDGDR